MEVLINPFRLLLATDASEEGRKYVPARERLRIATSHPALSNLSIDTSVVSQQGIFIVKATASIDLSTTTVAIDFSHERVERRIASAHAIARQDKEGLPNIESAETIAIGRALANLGIAVWPKDDIEDYALFLEKFSAEHIAG